MTTQVWIVYIQEPFPQPPHPLLIVDMKGGPWSKDEHKAFLRGFKVLGRGNWKGIATRFVITRTPTQVASHGQKYMLRMQEGSKISSRYAAFEREDDDLMLETPSESSERPLESSEETPSENSETPPIVFSVPPPPLLPFSLPGAPNVVFVPVPVFIPLIPPRSAMPSAASPRSKMASLLEVVRSVSENDTPSSPPRHLCHGGEMSKV